MFDILTCYECQDIAVKKSVIDCYDHVEGIAADLPSDSDLVSICNQLPDLMCKMFKFFSYKHATKLSSSLDGRSAKLALRDRFISLQIRW